VAVIVAVGVNTDGRREVLGVDIGPSDAETSGAARRAGDLRRARGGNSNCSRGNAQVPSLFHFQICSVQSHFLSMVHDMKITLDVRPFLDSRTL